MLSNGSVSRVLNASTRKGMAMVAVAPQNPTNRFRGVNLPYIPASGKFPKFTPRDNKFRLPDLSNHRSDAWSAEEIADKMKKHSIFAWGASDPLFGMSILVDHAEGVYLYDKNGKQYIDWAAGAVCTNLGHTVPEKIVNAVEKQMRTVPFLYSDWYYTEIRARLSELLAKVFPGDINGFIFPSGGSEANECAVRMARRYTGRPKIISRPRSYHGGTSIALNLTGDSRHIYADQSNVGFVKMADPFPLNFAWDSADEAAGWQRSLDCLHDQILFEGPETIAAIFLESIAGSNMWLKPASSWMQGVRALCDKYGILMIMDEVMTGFGRTGKMFGFENYEGVLPDIVTFAKGVTSSYLPMSGVGCRDHVFDFFRSNPLGYGSTYTAHPVSCAAAYETVKHLLEIDIVTHVKLMEAVMIEELEKLQAKHPCVRQARMHGLAGGFDLSDKDGNFLMWPHETHPIISALKNRMKEEGVVTIVRGHFVHCTPPLIITADEIRDGFQRLSKCLTTVDELIAAS